ncbi:MAG: uracil phosphoribosyltransferase [Spirochaetes bacterium]|nr:uracil phosphoribosyltransferase [Spirochaetota bacterium]
MIYESKHALLKHKLTVLRDKNTHYKEFRNLVDEITMLILYEALADIEIKDIEVETPLETTIGKALVNDIVIVPVLRAGVGMMDGCLRLIPNARVGFVGMYRDPETKKPVEYYEKLPEKLSKPIFYIIDPMLATGGSLIATIDLIKRKGYKNIKVLTIISSPEGIETLEKSHPDVDIYTGNIDRSLNDHKYILPGLGDAGDRLYGTK